MDKSGRLGKWQGNPNGPRKIPVDKSLLSEEDRAALLAEARKSVLEEMSQDARDAYFKDAVATARRERIPAEQFIHVMIDCAPYVPNIMINGMQYFHGYAYDVEQSLAVVLYEQMQRSWHHQDEIDGRRKSDAYRRPQDRRLGPSAAGTVTRGANGVVEAEI